MCRHTGWWPVCHFAHAAAPPARHVRVNTWPQPLPMLLLTHCLRASKLVSKLRGHLLHLTLVGLLLVQMLCAHHGACMLPCLWPHVVQAAAARVCMLQMTLRSPTSISTLNSTWQALRARAGSSATTRPCHCSPNVPNWLKGACACWHCSFKASRMSS